MLHSAPIQNRPKSFPPGGFNAPRGVLPSQAGQVKASNAASVADAAERIKIAAQAQEIKKTK